MNKICFLALISILSASCANTIFPHLSRTLENPKDTVPVVDSFSLEQAIHVSWDYDEGADMYIVMRSPNTSSGFFTELYRGKELSFTDTSVDTLESYYYRVDKIRGNKYFPSSGSAIGACPTLTHDILEPNDSLQQATYLGYAHHANITRYIFSDSRVLEDIDYYYVDLPPKATAKIVINEAGKASNVATSLKAVIEGRQDEVDVIQLQDFSVINTSNIAQRQYFRIRAKESITGNTISYRISLESIIIE